jgi:hypothetical protein
MSDSIVSYYKLVDKTILPKDIGSQKGVYTLFALDYEGKPIPLNRVLDVDNDGILYIGQTSKQDFKKRVDMLRRVLSPLKKSTGHSGAKNYKQIKKLQERFPLEMLYIKIEKSEEPKKRESQLIEEYRQKFGEVPPLNGSK